MVTVREELPRRLDDADVAQSDELSFGEIDLEIWLERLRTQLDDTGDGAYAGAEKSPSLQCIFNRCRHDRYSGASQSR